MASSRCTGTSPEWERDIDADLNYLELLPCEGSEAFVDDLENAPSFGAADE